MECPRCHYANTDGARFCGECGASLTRDVTCSSCGHANPAGQTFCNGCGGRLDESARSAARDRRAYTPKHLVEKILASRTALEGERKQVTVLFADVKGSMDLAEQIDPEMFHQVMERVAALLAEGVHRFEGTVTQFTGDGLMALFGAPIAHEDHAQRACFAALHLSEELRRYAEELKRTKGLGFAVRMGINSGEVVVGTIGDDLRMDYTAQGHTVGLAARMEQLADPGKVSVTEHTAALVSGFFQLRPLGAFEIKGVRDPLRVYELEGRGPLRTKLDVSRARGFTRFVGRDDEAAALEAALGRAIAGQGQVVGVVADAGVGKSRLCFEFAQRCRARGLAVYEAHAVAHGKAIPFLTLLEYLRGYFGISEQDPPLATREKVAGKVLLLDPELTDASPLLFDLLGVPDPERPVPRMDPEAHQRQIFAAMRRLTHAQSRREPGVSLIEDLHWIDGGSEAFLADFVETLPATRNLLVVNFRPEYHAGWMQRSYYQQLPLVPLGPAAIAELLRDLLGTDPSLAGLAERIRERTGGNPFFIEEIVQALVEGGGLEGTRGAYQLVKPAERLALPATVQAVLTARIDRLGEREKTVLQTAAVIGKEFAEPILQRVAGQPETELRAALQTLVRAEFLYEAALYPDAEYAFKHPLTQEVAYHSQLGDRRARVHAAVAGAIAELHAGKLDEHAALLAYHWEGAGDVLQAAEWSRRAAEQAGFRDPAEAHRHWQKVRELVARLPESPERLELRLTAGVQIMAAAWRLGMPEAEADAVYAETKPLAERATDLHALPILVGFYAVVKLNLGRLRDYLELATEEVRAADRTGDRVVAAVSHLDLVLANRVLGHLPDALAAADAARALLPDDPTAGRDLFGFSIPLNLVQFRILVLAPMGRLREAERELGRAVELAGRHGDFQVLAWLCATGVVCAGFSGDGPRALEYGRRGTELAEKVGDAATRANSYAILGYAHLLNEKWAEAIALLEGALALARDRAVGLFWEPFTLAVLAEAHLGSGEVGRAWQVADEAVARARQIGARVDEIQAELALARVLRHTEAATATSVIEEALRRASALIEETGARGYAPLVHVERAALARLTGDEATRQRELREAHRLFAEMGAPIRAEQVARELGA